MFTFCMRKVILADETFSTRPSLSVAQERLLYPIIQDPFSSLEPLPKLKWPQTFFYTAATIELDADEELVARGA